jgi:hypothetical protein
MQLLQRFMVVLCTVKNENEDRLHACETRKGPKAACSSSTEHIHARAAKQGMAERQHRTCQNSSTQA